MTASTTLDPAEIARFDAMARNWWDPRGPMAPLHALNPLRLEFIRDEWARLRDGADLTGIAALDVGCGGGLVSEGLARLGANVTAIDGAGEALAVARAHAEAGGLTIDYQCARAEELLAEGRRFALITALEVVEHVADRTLFISALAGLLAPGGVLILSTLNRTPKSWALAIAAAEYVLRWVPRGTHEWRKFVRPSELVADLRRAGLSVERLSGMVRAPLSGTWRLERQDLTVNYLASARRPVL